VTAIEFAPLDERGKRHRGEAAVVGSMAGLVPYRVFAAVCGERGAEWFYTENVSDRIRCRRCFPAAAGDTGAAPEEER
jgi:hypothetical protein